jgi:hypothetical protein
MWYNNDMSTDIQEAEMENYRTTIWQQWDRQEAKRIRTRDQNQAYIALNNLYLAIERGLTPLTIHTANNLRVLAGQAYDAGDRMIDWWGNEFAKLDGWLEV